MRRCVQFSIGVCALVVLSVLQSAPALAKEPTAQEKKAATDGFKSCHEQESYGDATACWHIWFDKYEHVGTEAEVLFAQERLKRAGVAPKLAPSVPKAVEPKATSSKPEPAPEVPPRAPEAAPAAPTTPAAPSAPASSGAVLILSGPNLCELKPKAGEAGLSRKRAIIFAPAGAERIESDAGIKRVGGAQQVREVFLQRFPLERFDNLLTTLPGQAGWEVKPSLSKDELKQYVTSATAGGDAAFATRLTQSLDCVDFLVFPAITAHSVKPMPAGKGAALELGLDGKLGIFKASATGFVLVTTLNASVPGFMDRAQDAAAEQTAKAMSSATSSANGATSQVNQAGGQLNNVANQAQNAANQAQSAADSASGAAANLANGQVPGGVGTGSANGSAGDGSGLVPKAELPPFKNPLGNMHERMSDACTKAKTPDDNLLCEVRVRAYQLSWHFRDDALSVEGWQRISPLLFGAGGDPSAPGVALGAEESLKVGDAFTANGPDGERLGYFKVVSVGPGGSGGQAQPSELNLRMGTASQGMQLREYRSWGLELTAHGAAEAILATAADHYVLVGDMGYAQYKMPRFAIGGGGSIGYDLSGLLASAETSVRVRAEYLSGNGTGLTASILPIDLSFEKGFYLGKGLNFFVALGPTLSLVKLKVALPILSGAPELPLQELSATRFGGQANTGLDILLSPRVALRFAGIFRYNLGSGYTASGAEFTWGDGIRDSFSTLGLNVGLNLAL